MTSANDMLGTLVGRSLDQLRVGVGELALVLGVDWRISLSGRVRVAGASSIEPTSIDGVAAHMPLLNAEVTAAHVDERGDLTVTLDGTAIRCEADDEYEAWSVHGSDGARIICLPRGELAIWTARTT